MNRFLLSALFILIAQPIWAGAFFGSFGLPACIDAACAPDDCPCDPFIIVHPIGYNGTGGVVSVDICINPADEPRVRPAVREAIDIWNSLTATNGNCVECLSSEELGPQDKPFILSTTILHELGHCAMGLGHSNHTNRQGPNLGPVNFTNTANVAMFDDGSDNIRGSRDDTAAPPPSVPPDPPQQTRVLHWFRKIDNNPVIIDGTVIDSNTYSRSKADLPSGSTWQANANRFVSDLLGAGDNTQSVMHTTTAEMMSYTGLTADDVNTVLFGMTGLDSIAGTTDDYSIQLSLVDDCASAEIELEFESLDPLRLGGCAVRLRPIDPVKPAIGYRHYSIEPVTPAGVTRLLLQISDSTLWDVVFSDGFETGNLSHWGVP